MVPYVLRRQWNMNLLKIGESKQQFSMISLLRFFRPASLMEKHELFCRLENILCCPNGIRDCVTAGERKKKIQEVKDSFQSSFTKGDDMIEEGEKNELHEEGPVASKQRTPSDHNAEPRIELENDGISLQPPWTHVISIRAFFCSLFLTMIIAQVLVYLFMTTRMSLPLSQFVSLGGYIVINKWMKWCTNSRPLFKQEHIVIWTCVVTSSTIILGAGYQSFLIGTDRAPSESLASIRKHIPIMQMIGFLLLISYGGFCCLLYLWKVIMDNNLPYQNAVTKATSTRRFHYIDVPTIIRKQIPILHLSSIAALTWGFTKWMLSKERNCGFTSIPTFGHKAYNHEFYSDFSATYVGIGMITPFKTTMSLLIGMIISWGLIWPLLKKKKGQWYNIMFSDTDLHGLQGYKDWGITENLEKEAL